MRFLMMWHPAANAASQNPPTPELMAAIDELMADMTRAGAIVDAGGMYPVMARLHLANGKVTTLDGPFAEAKELIGGYCVVRADSPEEAVAMARRFVQIHADHGYEGESEIRQMMHAEDFAAPAAQ